MARSRNTGVFIALAVFVVLAAVIRFYGTPIYQALIRLHGQGPGGH
jgi:ABC-type multidrug transport system permease subunit